MTIPRQIQRIHARTPCNTLSPSSPKNTSPPPHPRKLLPRRHSTTRNNPCTSKERNNWNDRLSRRRDLAQGMKSRRTRIRFRGKPGEVIITWTSRVGGARLERTHLGGGRDRWTGWTETNESAYKLLRYNIRQARRRRNEQRLADWKGRGEGTCKLLEREATRHLFRAGSRYAGISSGDKTGRTSDAKVRISYGCHRDTPAREFATPCCWKVHVPCLYSLYIPPPVVCPRLSLSILLGPRHRVSLRCIVSHCALFRLACSVYPSLFAGNNERIRLVPGIERSGRDVPPETMLLDEWDLNSWLRGGREAEREREVARASYWRQVV